MMSWLRATVALCLCLGVLAVTRAASATASAQSPNYTTTVIGPFSRLGSYRVALNDKGHVTGAGGGGQAFLYDGTLHNLGKPAGSPWSVGNSISKSDVIAATAQPHGIETGFAVTYSGGRAAWKALSHPKGFGGSEASAILPDSSAIAGTLCPNAHSACNQYPHRPNRAAVWKRRNGQYGAPTLLPVGSSCLGSKSSGIARANTITVVAGFVYTAHGCPNTNGGPVVWTLGGHGYLVLTGTKQFPSGATWDIAHGSGNTFYVAGTLLDRNGTSVTAGVEWTITCTVTTCRQTRMQVLTTFGDVFGVNSQGDAVGYSRPNGDGAGFNAIWHRGESTEIPINAEDINSSGQIAGWAVDAKDPRTTEVILLQPGS